ncbi:hypothetical protein SAMN02745136_03158 [Anaerocolumna jejuensis DSM 15929]|uniref:Uncharacterized protein n=2 Tax=Anaerocolumna TaxID=1843210 RepID=A0A1M6UMK9_9FIRM|nr:hypothetical protein SAMN02745136_03158 [Anaerocolumna jejuensis DSM 15929]
MSDFILEYDMLESIAAYSKSLGKRAGEYEESLEKKMISGIASITGPSTGYLQSASDSVRDKANALNQKSDVFYHYAEQITNLLETAERIDQEVADAITAQREYFLDHHKSLRLDDWKTKLLGLLVDLKNSIPLLGTIADLLEGLNTVIESLGDSIRHWYECEGGKYVIGEIAAIAEACLAVAVFAATFPISTFTGFCLAVGFGIAALNSCVNVKTSYKATEAAMDGNPALAEIYGKQDTLSDVLRQKNYGNGTMNDLSNFTAGALDVTEAVCITVGMAGQIVNLFKKSYNLLKYRKSLNYSGLQNNLENVIKEEYKNTKNIGLADNASVVGVLKESAEPINGFKADSAFEAMSSGAVDDILSKISVEEYFRLEELGESMYDSFRLMDDDYIKIAKNTDFSLEDLKDIKEHLFIKQHIFSDGSVRLFDANYWQAEAWDRLIKGTPEPSDITLLNHELFELKYMRDNNVPYEIAHAKANELFNWSKEVFGK